MLQASTGVSSLPPDLFIHILETALSEYSSLDGADTQFYPVYDIAQLLKINAVCRHWRWTALSSPTFWTYIPTSLRKELIVLFVQRSADALLHVRATYEVIRDWDADRKSQERYLSKLALLFPHLHRVRFLSLTLSTFSFSKVDTELIPFRRDLPSLEGFQIRIVGVPRGRVLGPIAVDIRTEDLVPSLLEKFGAPTLHGLHVTNAIIPTASLPVESLSRLSLTLDSTFGDLGVYLESVFKRCERLVSLSLDVSRVECHLDLDAPVASSPPSIPLTYLRRLMLEGASHQCSHVFRMLSMPFLKEVYVKVGYSGPWTLPLVHFIPGTSLGDHFHIKAKMNEVQIDILNSRQDVDKNPIFTLVMTGYFPAGLANSLSLLIVLKPRSFPEATILDFTTPYIYAKTFIPTFLTHFPNLHTFRIHYTTPNGKFPIEDSIDLKLLRLEEWDRTSRLLRNLVLDGFDVIMPQASPFLIELSSLRRKRRLLRLEPFESEFPNCKGIPDSLLRTFK